MIVKSKEISEKLTGFYKGYIEAYKQAAANSKKDYLATLQPGERIPAQEKLYTAESKEAFAKYSDQAKAEINSYLLANIKEVQRLKTNPPHPEAINYISMLNQLKEPEAGLIDIAMNRYGDNYITYKALHDIAAKHEMTDFKAPVLDSLEEVLLNEYNNIEIIDRNVNLNGELDTGKLLFMDENRVIPEYDSMGTVEGAIREPVSYY